MDLFKKWFSTSIQKISFEDIKYAIYNKEYIIINTLDSQSQRCLIKGTIPSIEEEKIINQFLESYNQASVKIILYGRNSVDLSVDEKGHQLLSLGFTKVFIYSGGLFEWLLLQDIYGDDEFPTSGKCKDLLFYRGSRSLGSTPKLLSW